MSRSRLAVRRYNWKALNVAAYEVATYPVKVVDGKIMVAIA